MNYLRPQTIRVALSMLARAVMFGVAVLGMRAVGGFFDPSASNPRRAFVFLLVLWVGTTVLAGILLVIWQ